MDNKKIGKLIADLRKEKGLTQEQLGEKVGVGFRAVSKWETGNTLPDIGIINELCKILGISSDELLTGQLNPKKEPTKKTKKSSHIIITISIITIILLTLTSIFIYKSNSVSSYTIISGNPEEYHIEGTMTFNKDNFSLSIDKIYFKDKKIINTMISNYEYQIRLKDDVIYGYGYLDTLQILEETISIKQLSSTMKINYSSKTKKPTEEYLNNGLSLKIKFLTEENQIIEKTLKMKLD